MPLRVAVQMDPLEAINIAGDSTFALMLKAQALGHSSTIISPSDLTYDDGRLYAGAHRGDASSPSPAIISVLASSPSSISAATSTSS